MNPGVPVTRETLREDIASSLEAVEAALSLKAPRAVLDCLAVETYFSFGFLVFPVGDTARLRDLAARLRSLLAGREPLPAARAGELAGAIVAFDPDFASWSPGAGWKGSMRRALDSDEIPFLAHENGLIRIPVRGAARGEAERRIAWLLGQLGVGK